MKLCVFADSHGEAEKLIEAVEKEAPALCFFLGDGERDLAAAQVRFPSPPFLAVRGNCDLGSALSAEMTCAVGGVTFFLTHGHLYDVKYESAPERLAEAARTAGAGVALFGHTHAAYCARVDGVLCLNPGAMRSGRYAVLSVADGQCTAELKTL